jgi:hypothetical protein
MLQTMTDRAAVATHMGALDLVDSMQDRLQQSRSDGAGLFQWVWVVLIGIFVVAAAAGFVYCRARGYDGFNGNVEAYKGPLGIKIGVKIGCY